METILMTGGTGLVGRALTRMLLQNGYQVIILTRKLPTGPVAPGLSYALWNIARQEIDIPALQQADHIIHLAGAGVMYKKWTAAYKKEIVDSRTQSSRLIIDTLKDHSHSVKTLVSASAIGWYGADEAAGNNAHETGFIESDLPDNHFLGDTCRQWEESVAPVTTLGIRLVKLRIGIVLSNDGGAFSEFKRPLRFGIAAVLGNGKQVISWIHIEDLCRLFLYAISNDQMSGAYNAVAPSPISNKALILQLATAMRGKFFIPLHVPVFVLKLMMSQRSIELLKSTRVSCSKVKEAGFTFLYPSIDAALHELVK